MSMIRYYFLDEDVCANANGHENDYEFRSNSMTKNSLKVLVVELMEDFLHRMAASYYDNEVRLTWPLLDQKHQDLDVQRHRKVVPQRLQQLLDSLNVKRLDRDDVVQHYHEVTDQKVTSQNSMVVEGHFRVVLDHQLRNTMDA